MNAPSRPKKLQLHELEAYSRFDEDTKVFHIPNLDILKGFQVVVSTCVSAWILHGIGVNRGHFTHIFIDEAGQPSEPEAMIAIKTMAGPNTNVILSGDPKQLGPIVHSPVADKLGMGVSYLDRLMMLPDMYEPHESHGIT
jgi:helicase MOV-10